MPDHMNLSPKALASLLKFANDIGDQRVSTTHHNITAKVRGYLVASEIADVGQHDERPLALLHNLEPDQLYDLGTYLQKEAGKASEKKTQTRLGELD